MAINVYLVFNGKTREAIELYKEAFQTQETQIMTFGEGHQNDEYPIPEEAKDLVMHARMTIMGSEIMFSDTFPGQPHTVGNNVTLSVLTDDEEKLRYAFDVLKRDGNVQMELQETFWSKCYGNVADKFGVEWQFNLEQA
ncbi:VOC family protein [Bacillus ndiopicus]|uniref:VOC family protein n=1 Tax=Bacillus ndiopicus TaxID=1347368 RepID=UPI0005A6F828|nr:VOC family protein [Bacillus ndiopicus]